MVRPQFRQKRLCAGVMCWPPGRQVMNQPDQAWSPTSRTNLQPISCLWALQTLRAASACWNGRANWCHRAFSSKARAFAFVGMSLAFEPVLIVGICKPDVAGAAVIIWDPARDDLAPDTPC